MYETRTVSEQIVGYDSAKIALFTMNDSNNNAIISGANVTGYMNSLYGQYKSTADLYTLWSLYNATHYADFLKAYSAWISDYSPLSNYDSREVNVHIENDGERTETTTHGKTITSTPTNWTSTTSTAPYDSTTLRDETAITQTGTMSNSEGGETTTTIDTDVKSLDIDGDTYTADKVTGDILTKKGNIGVTTSQEMLKSEIDLRSNPIAVLYIDTFINTYTYYIGGAFDEHISNFI